MKRKSVDSKYPSPPVVDTLEKELDYLEYISKQDMKRGRAKSITQLKEIIREANEWITSIETDTTNESIIYSCNLSNQMSRYTENLQESDTEWYNASRKLEEVNHLKTLYAAMVAKNKPTANT
jgi:hypothetical protein